VTVCSSLPRGAPGCQLGRGGGRGLGLRLQRGLRNLDTAAVPPVRRRPPTAAPGTGSERLLAALPAGRRYVWNAPGVRRGLPRTLLFIPGGAALWALLPLTASQPLGPGSGGYGLMLSTVGMGAVARPSRCPACAAR
jgi:hypothetical protein